LAFPFGWNPPCLADVIKVCCQNFGARVVELPFEVEGEFGKVRPRVLERDVGGRTLHVVLPNLPDDVLINLHSVRNMCARLQIPTEAFQFQFDDDAGLVVVNPKGN
jgi:hypothetical protein